MRAFLVHSNRDNVGVAIVEIKRGQTLRGAALDGTASTLQLTAVEGIPVGHKIALKDLKAGDTVMKYGEDIGRVVADIPRGAHVHVHNLKTKRWLSMQDLEFRGYRREDGRVGIRNHVVILPVDDISNAASEAVGRVIQGTLPLPHAYGRLQFGEDLELFFRTLIGVGSNPNVAAALVIGIEPGWTERVVQGIVKTGKPVMGFSIERHGDLRTIAEVSRKAQEYVQWASELSTEECSMNEI